MGFKGERFRLDWFALSIKEKADLFAENVLKVEGRKRYLAIKKQLKGIDLEHLKVKCSSLSKSLANKGFIKIRKKCDLCNKHGKHEYWLKLWIHHPTYSDPYEVMFLCKCCHSQEHVRINKMLKASK